MLSLSHSLANDVNKFVEVPVEAGLAVREGEVGGLAMVVAHATVADAPEWQAGHWGNTAVRQGGGGNGVTHVKIIINLYFIKKMDSYIKMNKILTKHLTVL